MTDTTPTFAFGDNAVIAEAAVNRMFGYAVADMLTADSPKGVSEMRAALARTALSAIAAAGMALPPRDKPAKRGKGKPAKSALERAIDRALMAAQHVVKEYSHKLAPALRTQNARDAESLAPHVLAYLAGVPKAANVNAVERERERMRGIARREREREAEEEREAAGITAETEAANDAMDTAEEAVKDAKAAPDKVRLLTFAALLADKAGAPHIAAILRDEANGRVTA